MASPEEKMASKPSAVSASTEITSPTSPTIPVVSPTDIGWKITIKNADGTSNEVTLEPKSPERTDTMRSIPLGENVDHEKVQDPTEKKPTKLLLKLKIYLIIQYILNAILAVVIIVIMALTLAQYNSTKNAPGAWPPNPVLSPTFIMLIISCVNVLMDAINLLVQCCGVRVLRTVATIVTKVRTVTGVVAAIMPAVAVGIFKFANVNTNNTDLWGASCNNGNATSEHVANVQSTICNTNTVAYPLQVLQVWFQLFCVIVPLYGKWRATKEAAAARGPSNTDAEEVKLNINDEAGNLIDESRQFSGM
ncbi:hypothetical protein OIDMADRAFT_31418 [Oidiodendron maius Zn]|uniref:Uncharacterized protein n=1 Tax=Oidiodendron maius (strain Zn) TaxID=913774 RepID=A0A0C3H5T4_OIDMZ|nr:hypothetical protein OIDMADRAFT_31418 [Oidiodendron maius Zn]